MSGQSGSIPRSFIESLLSRADVVQVINQRVPLKKAGGTYKACCPFHDEKTPSFNVNPSKQFYHCFGCGASGDALKFIMEYDGLSFVEAVESLASQMGMEVPREKLSPEKQKRQQIQQQQQRDLYDVMHLAAKFYRHQLRDHAVSDQAKGYLKGRGLSAEVAKQYVIGFAPPGWNALETGLKADAQLTKQLVDVGLLVQKEDGKTYDRFRNRIMFPIRDGRGRVIAFGGRVLSSEDQPKYLNSPETPIFHKSYALYGLYEMRQTREKFDHIIVVEGYMDVVALAQYGIYNAVATLGTATTVEHLDMLFRQVNEVVFCFDGDQAGTKAAWKALELALPMMENERSVKFLFLPDGEDPDSMVRQDGKAGFAQRIGNALSLSDFLLTGLQGRLSHPLHSIEGRQQIVALAQPYVQSAHGLYQFLLAEGLAELVDLPTWRVEKQMNVRSGFAQFKKDEPAKVERGSAVTVMTVPLRLIRILLSRPYWVDFFTTEIIRDLVSDEELHYQILGRFLTALQKTSGQAERVLQSMRKAGYEAEVELILQAEMPNDDAFLANEFEVAVEMVSRHIDESGLGKSGWNQEEIERLQLMVQKPS